ncbi:fasciclin-2 isoform X1 [Dermacentor albipictus]|uniref:fasciclin-2 isoform X1 n=1 Tax=Dermacentor albipictus TaxID=60249 RepID=UPI0031FDA865
MTLKLLCSFWRMPSQWLIFSLVISSLPASSYGQTQPSLVINPIGENKTEPAGTGFVLFCTKGAGEAEFSEFKWTGPNGQEITGQESIRVVPTGESYILSFDSPSPQDSGSYTCSALYGKTIPLSITVHITFYHDITWEDCPQSQHLILGQPGKVRCRVRGNPVPLVSWLKDREELDPQRYEGKEDGISVQTAQDIDRGTYVVSAMVSVTGKFQKRNITVDVYTQPKISPTVPDSSELVEGSPGSLKCSAEGYPPPLFYWFDQANRNLSTVNGFQVDSKAGLLQVTSVRREDEGTYRCQALNPAGTDSREIAVAIIVKPRITEFQNATVSVGEEVKLECRAHGKPIPDMKIRRDGNTHFLLDQHFKFQETQNDQQETVLTMTAMSATREMDGLYYCSAENKADKVERVGHLTVQFAPQVFARENPVKTWGQRPAVLECVAEAIPNATLAWFYRKQQLQERTGQYFKVEGSRGSSKLTVAPTFPDRFGTYVCEAQNFLGKGSVDIRLEEARLPGALPTPRVESLTPTTITFAFIHTADDGGMPTTKIIIKYWKDGDREELAKIQEWSDMDRADTVTVDGLEPKHKYWFRFAAHSAVGTGPYSETLSRETPPEMAPDPPIVLSNENSMYPNKYEIRWAMPRDNGRPVHHFRVTYFKVDKRPGNNFVRAEEPKVIQVTEWHNVPRVELRNLSPESYYRAEIEAYNDIGYSEPESMVFHTARGEVPTEEHGGQQSRLSGLGLPLTTIIIIVVAAVLLVLLLLDVVCYLRFHWGFLYCLRHSCGGGQAPAKPVADDAKSSPPTVTEPDGGKTKPKAEKSISTDKELLSTPDEKTRDAAEDTPMIDTKGLKDGKHDLKFEPADKNHALKGSKSSIAKDSMV